jgi:hypothetical protein
MKRDVIVVTMLFLLNTVPLISCTIFIASDKKQVLVGNNEDYIPTLNTYFWVRPCEKGNNGYVFWGFDEKYPEGGMNEKGLFYDAAALPKIVDLKKDSYKLDYNGYIVEKVLQECSTVKEVLMLVRKYNLTWYDKVQVFIADKTGDYAIINASYIIHPSDKEFVLTNYNLNDSSSRDFKCWRRNTAYQLLKTNPISIGLFTKILDKTSQRETDNATVYSQVCDLEKNIIYLYQKHDFTKVERINLVSLLKKGRQDIQIKDLFPPEVQTYIKEYYFKNGIDNTINEYKVKRKQTRGEFNFSEKDLEALGYQLIDSGKMKEAERLFLLNLEYYPNSDNANAALANAYLLDGKEKEANDNFEKVRQINSSNYYLNLFGPNNDSITFRIKGIQGAQKLAVVGKFNNYDTNANLFVRKGDEWICKMKILPGDYAYKFNIDDTYWIQDPSNQMHIKPNDWWDSYLRVQ